jgi:hypothetical protein
MMHQLLLIIFVCALLAACKHRHDTASVQSTLDLCVFPQPEVNFNRYRQNVHDYLRSNSLPNRNDRDIQLNLPFEIGAKKMFAIAGSSYCSMDSVTRPMSGLIMHKSLQTADLMFGRFYCPAMDHIHANCFKSPISNG